MIAQHASSVAVRYFMDHHRHDQDGDLKYKVHGVSIPQTWLKFVQYLIKAQWLEAATPTGLALSNLTQLGWLESTQTFRKSVFIYPNLRKLSLSPYQLALSKLSINTALTASSKKPGLFNFFYHVFNRKINSNLLAGAS